MDNFGSNVLILKSIEELRAKKKRPNHESVVSHAQKHHGLSINDGRESLCCLLNNGSVFNRPMSAGLISLFAKEESNNNIFESTKEGGEGQLNDSFLCFLDSVETPTKELSHQSLLMPREIEPKEKSLLTIIEKLADNNSQLNNLLNTEREKNTNLTNENVKLIIEIEKQKATVEGDPLSLH